MHAILMVVERKNQLVFGAICRKDAWCEQAEIDETSFFKKFEELNSNSQQTKNDKK